MTERRRVGIGSDGAVFAGKDAGEVGSRDGEPLSCKERGRGEV
jgi:hypothetical protein